MDFFIHPERFWHLIWILPALIALGAFAALRRKRALKQLLGAAHFSASGSVPVGVNLSPGKRLFRFLLLLATALLLTAAWARPTWGEKIHPFTGAGRDIIVALDLSKSMLAQDVRPNRLTHAKRFAEELAERLPGDRFGLVAFAGNAFLSCPLTFDRVSFRAILDDQQIGSVPLGGTNLETALKTAAASFESAENLGHCAIVLISDGGELSGSLAREAEKLRAAKIPVVVVGVGDPAVSAPIPLSLGNGRSEYLKDRDGNTVNTRLEERALAELAAKTGGVYIRSTTTEMGDALAAAWLKKLTPGAQKENVHAVPIERREWFLVPALVAFFLYLLLGETASQTRGMRAAAFSILLRAPKAFIALTLAGVLAVQPDASAQASAPEPTEEETSENAQSEERESPETLYNRGLHAQEDGDIERSREWYRDALAGVNVTEALRSATTQNLGAGFHVQGREGRGTAAVSAQSNLDEALKNVGSAEENFKRAQTFYRDFLRGNANADSAGATRNLQILLNDLQELDELKKQIEELKKQMQEAAQQAQNAAQEQNRANEQKDEKQENSEQQQKAQNAAQQAAQQAGKMQEAAENLNNESLKNAAQQAAQELQKAQEEQTRGNGENAQEHLEKAVEILKQAAEQNSGKDDQKNQDSQGDKNRQDSAGNENGDQDQKDGGNEQSNADQGSQDDLAQEPKEDDSQTAQGGNAGEERELDRDAAESVLRDMAQDEAERRKAIQSGKNAQIRNVEKDW